MTHPYYYQEFGPFSKTLAAVYKESIDLENPDESSFHVVYLFLEDDSAAAVREVQHASTSVIIVPIGHRASLEVYCAPNPFRVIFQLQPIRGETRDEDELPESICFSMRCPQGIPNCGLGQFPSNNCDTCVSFDQLE